jgi:hypothetical protein
MKGAAKCDKHCELQNSVKKITHMQSYEFI